MQPIDKIEIKIEICKWEINKKNIWGEVKISETEKRAYTYFPFTVQISKDFRKLKQTNPEIQHLFKRCILDLQNASEPFLKKIKAQFVEFNRTNPIMSDFLRSINDMDYTPQIKWIKRLPNILEEQDIENLYTYNHHSIEDTVLDSFYPTDDESIAKFCSGINSVDKSENSDTFQRLASPGFSPDLQKEKKLVFSIRQLAAYTLQPTFIAYKLHRYFLLNNSEYESKFSSDEAPKNIRQIYKSLDEVFRTINLDEEMDQLLDFIIDTSSYSSPQFLEKYDKLSSAIREFSLMSGDTSFSQSLCKKIAKVLYGDPENYEKNLSDSLKNWKPDYAAISEAIVVNKFYQQYFSKFTLTENPPIIDLKSISKQLGTFVEYQKELMIQKAQQKLSQKPAPDNKKNQNVSKPFNIDCNIESGKLNIEFSFDERMDSVIKQFPQANISLKIDLTQKTLSSNVLAKKLIPFKTIKTIHLIADNSSDLSPFGMNPNINHIEIQSSKLKFEQIDNLFNKIHNNKNPNQGRVIVHLSDTNLNIHELETLQQKYSSDVLILSKLFKSKD